MNNSKKVVLIVLTALIIFIFVKVLNQKDGFKEKIEVVNTQIETPIENKKVVEQIVEKEVSDKEMNSQIFEIVQWSGADPYPSVDWSGAQPELKTTVENFEKKWGKPLSVRQVYRPAMYGVHMRSVWEVWRYVNGKSYTEGYKCEDYKHVDIKSIGILNQAQKDYLNMEANRHGFIGGDTPPGCVSDHALGIAVDITPPFEPVEYERFINTANSVGLCHYIKGDEPHFGLTSYLPEGTDCFIKFSIRHEYT